MNIKQSNLFGLVLLLLVVMMGFMIWKETKAPQQIVPGTPTTTIQGGYSPFPLGELRVYLKQESSPNTPVTTSSIKGRIYDSGATNIASPMTPYVDSATIGTTAGNLSFTGGNIYTSTSYKLKIWDDSSSPTWYAKLIDFTVPALDPNMGANAKYTLPNVYLEKIGTFADPMQSDATGPGGAQLPTGVTSSHLNNKVTINASKTPGDRTTLRFTLTLANTAVGSKLKKVVLRPIQDTTNPMPTTAFTSAIMTYVSGTNLNIPSDILPYIQSQQPIPLGDWTDSTSATYYLQVTIDENVIRDNDTFYFRIDDLGNWLGTDPIDGSSGASSVYFYIENQEEA
jgi:hypothetical protein